MIAVLLVPIAIVAFWLALRWLIASPLRLVISGAIGMAAHPTLTIAAAALIAALISAVGVVIVWRAVREFGGGLVVATAPANASSST